MAPGILQWAEGTRHAFPLAALGFSCEQAGAGEGARLSSRATSVIKSEHCSLISDQEAVFSLFSAFIHLTVRLGSGGTE